MAVCKTGRGSQTCRKPHCSRLGKYIGLAALERARSVEVVDEKPGGGGLDFGITSWDIRMLTENPWNGGGGFSYDQVARMTPDQVYHRLCKQDSLKVKNGHRIVKANPVAVTPDARGMVKGRTADGQPFEAPATVGGKSLARRLIEQAKEKVRVS